MPEKWTGNLIAKMHNNQISATELATEAGFTKAYISMILNGHRNPPGMQKTLEEAVARLIARKKADRK